MPAEGKLQDAHARTRVRDRRRPGRAEVNPALIPLLRRHFPADSTADAVSGLAILPGDEEHPLAGARGIVIGLALSLPLWAVIYAGCRVLIRALG